MHNTKISTLIGSAHFLFSFQTSKSGINIKTTTTTITRLKLCGRQMSLLDTSLAGKNGAGFKVS